LTPGVNIILGEAPNQSAPIVTALWRHKRRSRLVPPLGGHNPADYSADDVAKLQLATSVCHVIGGGIDVYLIGPRGQSSTSQFL